MKKVPLVNTIHSEPREENLALRMTSS